MAPMDFEVHSERDLAVARGSSARPSLEVSPKWHLWIDGKEVTPRAEQYDPLTDPATGEPFCHAGRGGAEDVHLAVRAAADALGAWAGLPGLERGRLLLAVAQRLREATAELAILETLSSGKPLREARQDVEKSAEAFEFYGGLADKLFGTTIPGSPGCLAYTVREPIGVTAHISPWNYPLRLSVRSIAPALAAGNTVVLKPAEQTPLTVLCLARMLADCGVPHGVFNVVMGLGPEAGAALSRHPLINHLSFTGSVATGVKVARAAARNVVPVTLELGGKSPNIVFADADLDRALEGAIKAIFTNAGQVCCAGSRLFLEERIYDDFLGRLTERTRRLRLGPGLEDPDMGPLISASHRQRVLDYIALAQEERARLVLGGGVPDLHSCRSGYFVEPTLLEGLPNTARAAREEIFGPVLTVFAFRTAEEVIRLANDNPYGLVAGVWTSNLDRAHRVASQIQAGQVYVNDFFSGSVAVPFGGYKRSGFGRERGVEAFNHYTQVKGICVRVKD